MNALVPVSPLNAMIPKSMGEAMQLAEMMARGKMMPEHIRNPGDALMVIEQAMRWQMSPYAVAQATFSIKGKLLFAGTLVAAAIEHSGAIIGLMDYQFSGDGINRKVIVSATRKGEAAPKTIEVLLKDAQTANEQWKKQPDQMLAYHGARVWARRWTPGVMLGVYTPDEMADAPAPDTFAGTTIDARAETPDPATKKQTSTQWLDEIDLRLRDAADGDAVDAIIAEEKTQKMLDWLQNGAKSKLNGMIAEALSRTRPEDFVENDPDHAA